MATALWVANILLLFTDVCVIVYCVHNMYTPKGGETMRKVNKHYRLGYHTCDKLDILKNLMVGKTETAIVEEAICKLADTVIIDEGEHIKVVNENVRKIRINRGY